MDGKLLKRLQMVLSDGSKEPFRLDMGCVGGISSFHRMTQDDDGGRGRMGRRFIDDRSITEINSFSQCTIISEKSWTPMFFWTLETKGNALEKPLCARNSRTKETTMITVRGITEKHFIDL